MLFSSVTGTIPTRSRPRRWKTGAPLHRPVDQKKIGAPRPPYLATKGAMNGKYRLLPREWRAAKPSRALGRRSASAGRRGGSSCGHVAGGFAQSATAGKSRSILSRTRVFLERRRREPVFSHRSCCGTRPCGLPCWRIWRQGSVAGAPRPPSRNGRSATFLPLPEPHRAPKVASRGPRIRAFLAKQASLTRPSSAALRPLCGAGRPPWRQGDRPQSISR